MRPNSCFASKNFIFLLLCSFLFFFAVSTPRVLEASLFNPLVEPTLPGFEAFLQGKTYFEEEKWEEAIDCFKRAIQESHKPVFDCRCFTDDEGDHDACHLVDLVEDKDTITTLLNFDGNLVEEKIEFDDYLIDFNPSYNFSKRQATLETDYSLYRHSRFYLGLIFLYQGKIKSAHFNFLKAILFTGAEEKIYPVYFRCINCLNPAWIIQASLTSLALGDVNLAAQLSGFALNTNELIEDCIYGYGNLYFDWWSWSRYSELLEKYRRDLVNSKLMNKKWVRIQEILIHNVKSLVAQA